MKADWTNPLTCTVPPAERQFPRASDKIGLRRLSRFFLENPDAGLTVAQAAEKIGVSEQTARQYLTTMRSRGEVARQMVFRKVK